MSNWKHIESEKDLSNILEKSKIKTQIIFKHSTSCGISAHAEHRLISGTEILEEKADFNYLDLLEYRSISNLIANQLKVTHQSPQIIVIKNGEVIYTSSHSAIDAKKIESVL